MLHHSGSDNPCRHSPSNGSLPEEFREFRLIIEFNGKTLSRAGCRASSLLMSYLRSPWQFDRSTYTNEQVGITPPTPGKIRVSSCSVRRRSGLIPGYQGASGLSPNPTHRPE